MTASTHFDIAFAIMVVAYVCLFVTALLGLSVWWWSKKKTRLKDGPPKSEPRLKIISAYFGVEGGYDVNVAEEYLKPRMQGNTLAGWVGSDLFGPLDPVIGQRKRLKVRYTFDGKETEIIRPQDALLIIPEDVFLREQLDTCRRDLSRIQESLRHCEEDVTSVITQKRP